MNRLENQTLALAGMFQAVTLVDEIALHGSFESESFDCSLDSLFTIEAASAEDAIGSGARLVRGFESLGDYLGGQNKSPGRNVAYYLLSIMKISAQVLRNPGLSKELLDGLNKIETDTNDFEMSRTSVINKIDGLYQDKISSLNPRILVRGDQNYLRNADTAAWIWVLILAGIRAAVLWQQLGGNKWNLFWSRKKYVSTAARFLRQN
jgi:high frequency lysogenization protein